MALLELGLWLGLGVIVVLLVASLFPPRSWCLSEPSASVPFRWETPPAHASHTDWVHSLKVFVISLDPTKARAQARRALVESSFFHVEGVDTRSKPVFGKFKLPGEIGCALSHFKALELARASFPDPVLVLEDDVHFVESYQQLLVKTVRELSRFDPQWAMLRLGSSQYFPPVGTTSRSFAKDNTGTCGMFAVVYNPALVKKLQQFLKQNGVHDGCPVDALDRMFCSKLFCQRVSTYTCVPPLAVPNVSESLIRGHRSVTTHSARMGWNLAYFPTYPFESSRHFVVVVPSFNNEDWVIQNLTSVFAQKHSNFSVVYVDDHSSDRTAERVGQLMAGRNDCAFIQNPTRMGQAYSRYVAYSACETNSTCFFFWTGMTGWLTTECLGR